MRVFDKVAFVKDNVADMKHLERLINRGAKNIFMLLPRWSRRFFQFDSRSALVTLLLVLGFVALYSFYEVWRLSSGVHIICDCGGEVPTNDRVDRYLKDLLLEFDSTTNRTVKDAILDSHPSLAIDFLTRQETRGKRCFLTPGLFSVRHRNAIWQEAEVARYTFLAYGAYYDDRDEKAGPLVRVLVMVESTWPPTPTCHLWYKNDVAPTATRAIRVEYVHWQEKLEGHWLPYIVTCTAGGSKTGVPEVVSLVSDSCSPATNALRIHHQVSSPKRHLALCHKFVFNPARDFSVRLTEWIENLNAWGVDHLTIYEAASHPNVRKVLTYYQKKGFVTILPWTSPGSQPQLPHLYRILYDTQRYSLFTDENIPYTDCLLRNIGTHRYVGIWDVDEFIFPSIKGSLPEMLDDASARASRQGLSPTSYLARCTYFFDDAVEQASEDLPEYLHMMRHVTRTLKFLPPKTLTKAIHDTSRALGLHAHFALLNLEGSVDRDRELYNLYPGDEAILAHYRQQCQGENQTECETIFRPFLVRDERIWRYRSKVAQNTKDTLRTLQLLP